LSTPDQQCGWFYHQTHKRLTQDIPIIPNPIDVIAQQIIAQQKTQNRFLQVI
jgi:Lhr-like helicase